MKSLDINKSNELINEFMQEYSFQYHQGYDHIMRVIEKIESLGFIVSNDQSDTTILENKAFASAFIRVYGTRYKMPKSESFYRAAVDFIKWFNSKK